MTTKPNNWIILIVDDEELIHKTLKANLQNIEYSNKKIEFFHAYSSLQAKELIKKYPKIAIIILDVMMEEDDSGLSFVKYIREEVKNNDVRILLHTGQPHIAPKKEVSDQYIIDGYLDKDMPNNDDCYVAVRIALRSYEDRLKLKEATLKDDVTLLEKITEIYISVLKDSSLPEEYEKTAAKINNIVHLSQEILTSYTLKDLKNDLNAGTTKVKRLSAKDYSALIQIHNIKIILTHTSIKQYKKEKTIIFDTIVKTAKNFSNIKILPDSSKKRLKEQLQSF